jgi:hypothetical protein
MIKVFDLRVGDKFEFLKVNWKVLFTKQDFVIASLVSDESIILDLTRNVYVKKV